MAEVKLRKVRKAFGDAVVIKDVDLDLEHGEFAVSMVFQSYALFPRIDNTIECHPVTGVPFVSRLVDNVGFNP